MTPEEQARLAQTIVAHCAVGHVPIYWYSRRDQPVPCPICALRKLLVVQEATK